MGQRGRGGFDLVLDSGDLLMGFVFDRSAVTRSTQAPAIRTEIGPARLGSGPQSADTPRTIDSLENGMGFSRRVDRAPAGYAHCLPGYTRAPGAILSPPGKLTAVALPASWDTNAIVDSWVANDTVFLVTQGRQVLQLVGASPNGPATVAFDGGSGWRGWGATIFNNRLYVSGAFGGLAYYDLATGVWTGPASPVVPRAYPVSVTWRPLGVPTQVLVALDPSAAWGARWCPIYADPMVGANWSAAVPIGTDRAYIATGAVAAPRHVYFTKADGVYDIDELGARSYNIAPWIGENRDGNNGLWAMHTGAGLYYGHSQGLAYVPTQGEAQNDPLWAHPTWGLPYEGPIRGVATAGALHQGWRLVGLFDNLGGTATSYVCAGLPSQAAYGNATHVWHGAEASLPGMVTHMKVHTPVWIGGWPMLLICTTDLQTPPTVHVYWQSLPKIGSPIQEMLLGGAFVPGPAASLFLPTDDWGQPAAIKTLLEIDMVTANLSSTATLQAWAKADEGDWADQGTADLGAFTSFRPVSPTSGRSVSARIDCSGPSILRSLELRSALGIELREARTYDVVLGADDGLRTPRGAQWRDPERRLMDLRGMLGRVVTVDDGTGPRMRCRVLQVLPGARRPIGAPVRAGAWTMTAELTVTVLDRPFRYDADDVFDADRTWS